MHHTVSFALVVKYPHKFAVIGAHNAVHAAVSFDIFIFQPGETFVQLSVKVFSVPFPQSEPDAKADHPFDPAFGA